MPKASKKEAISEISKEFDSYILSDKYKHFAKSISDIYFGKEKSIKKENLDLNFDDFQSKVLLEVLKIPCGEIRTYKQISDAINSKAYRAVGTAIGKNPLPLIIPCHRVIRSDLKIGGFFGGTEMKKKILENEGICIINGKIKQK
ncbi:MAG: methylated-DNA--[protein]-cysteine S-methyltransferase [Methanobacterium sp.]